MASGRDEHFLYKTENNCLLPKRKIASVVGDIFGSVCDKMIFKGVLVIFFVSLSRAATESSDEEIPFVVASQSGSSDPKVSNLLPDIGEPDVPPLTYVQSPANRGRSDIEIEDEQPSGGYFYPKPSKPFDLPEFKTLDRAAFALSAGESPEIQRLPRSPRRRPPYFPSPPQFVPGFIPPNQMRPLPALYGRPQRY